VGDVKEREPALAIRSAQRPAPEAIPIARAKLEPRPAPAPGNQWVQPAQLQVATAAYPRSEDATSARSYWVQVAAFKSLEAAMRLASLLRVEKSAMSDRWAVVMEPGSAGATLARVRVGPFSERAEAASNLRDLQALGYKPFIAEERD
jgi:cell division septation protein DedD